MLQEQVKEFSLLAIEERNEKRERIAKHDDLQKELRNKAETFAQQRMRLGQKLYLFIGLCIALLVAVGSLLYPYILLLRKK